MTLMELKEAREITVNDKAWAGKAFEKVYDKQVDDIDAQTVEAVSEAVNKAEEILCDVSRECVEVYQNPIHSQDDLKLRNAVHNRFIITRHLLVELGMLTEERSEEIYVATKNNVLDKQK